VGVADRLRALDDWGERHRLVSPRATPQSRSAATRQALLNAGFVLAVMAASVIAVTLVKNYRWASVAVAALPLALGLVIGTVINLARIRRQFLSAPSPNVETDTTHRGGVA
jgi:hypothetical protein